MTNYPEALVERACVAFDHYLMPNIWDKRTEASKDRGRNAMRAALDASGLREAVEALEKISAHVPLEQAYDDVLGQRIGIARATLDRIKGAPND